MLGSKAQNTELCRNTVILPLHCLGVMVNPHISQFLQFLDLGIFSAIPTVCLTAGALISPLPFSLSQSLENPDILPLFLEITRDVFRCVESHTVWPSSEDRLGHTLCSCLCIHLPLLRSEFFKVFFSYSLSFLQGINSLPFPLFPSLLLISSRSQLPIVFKFSVFEN